MNSTNSESHAVMSLQLERKSTGEFSGNGFKRELRAEAYNYLLSAIKLTKIGWKRESFISLRQTSLADDCNWLLVSQHALFVFRQIYEQANLSLATGFFFILNPQVHYFLISSITSIIIFLENEIQEKESEKAG